MSCIFSGVRRGDVTLTDSELRVIDEFKRVGMRALDGQACHKWCSSEEPGVGWALCACCNLPMPAGKIEMVKSEGIYNAVWFYHIECYLHIVDQSIRSEPVDRGVRVYPLLARDASESDTIGGETRSYLDDANKEKTDMWDLDKPEGADYD
eukprot:jgi/Mesvir1/1529/Mv14512-RA.1